MMPTDDRVMRLAYWLWRYDLDAPYEPGESPPNVPFDEFARQAGDIHEGDCTGLPAPCARCLADYWMAAARWFVAESDMAVFRVADLPRRVLSLSLMPDPPSDAD